MAPPRRADQLAGPRRRRGRRSRRGRRAGAGRAPARTPRRSRRAAHSAPISAPVSQAARRPAAVAADSRADASPAGGWARQCGGRSRATRPPSWSTISTARSGSTSRSAAVSARSCAGSCTLRPNRMTPAGGCARSSAASAAVSCGPGDPDDGGLHCGRACIA